MRLGLGAVALLSTQALFAAEPSAWFTRIEPGRAVLTGFISSHLNAAAHERKMGMAYNENNQGIGIRLGDGVFFGYYENSYFKDSFYAGKEFQWRLKGPVHVGITAGAVSGYGHIGLALQPYVLPELVLKFRPLELALTAIPKTKKTPMTVAAQLRVPF